MKKLLVLILAVMLVFSGCGKKQTDSGAKNAAPEVQSGADTKAPADKKDESTPPAEKKEEAEKGEENNASEEKQEQDSEPAATQEEFENLMSGYEEAKESGDKEKEREYLDEIQKILEQAEASAK